MTTVVGLQVLAVVVALARMASTPLHYGLLGALAVAGLALAIPMPTGSLGTTLLRRLSFVTRPRVVGQGAPAARRSGAADPGPGPAGASESPAQALHPGLVLRSLRDHRGHSLGVAQWAQTLTAVVAVSDGPGPVVRPDLAHRLPLRAIAERLGAGDIPVEAVTVLQGVPAAGAAAAASGSAWRGRRDIFVSVRVRPLEARAAIARRGGGRAGTDACLAALTAAIVAEVRAAGLTAEGLDTEGVRQALDLLALPGAGDGHPAGADAPVWTEGWREVIGPGGVHRSLVATRWRPSAAPAMPGSPASAGPSSSSGSSGPSGVSLVGGRGDLALALAGDPIAGLTVGVELRPARPGSGPRAATVRIVARVSTPSAGQVAQAQDRLVTAAPAAGLRLAVAAGDQLAALRASSLLGDGAEVWSHDGAAMHPILAARLPVAADALDQLAPVVGGGVFLGRSDDGTAYGIDLVRAQPQRLAAVGEGWLAGVLAGRAARCGVRVVVLTDRPAPWTALMRQLGIDGAVDIVLPDARTLPGDGELAARLVVVTGLGTPVPGARRPWHTVLHVLPALPAGEGGASASLGAGIDAVLVTRDAVTDELVRQTGVPAAPAARLAGLGEFEVGVVSGGSVEVVRVDPNL